MKTLFVIPARGGSKGIPGKNWKPLAGKPLILYSLELARTLSQDDDICVSTDDLQIANIVESAGYKIPFLRPQNLASDNAGSYEMLLHAVQHYETKSYHYDRLVLLQPTSPFRTSEQVLEAMNLFNADMDMVVSVKETKSNPYYMLMEENAEGWLQKSKESHFIRRQDIPTVYELNGAIYVLNISSLKREKISAFKKIRKYLMDEITSQDIDTPFDWIIAEAMVEKGIIKN